jgi:hypothetical protein
MNNRRYPYTPDPAFSVGTPLLEITILNQFKSVTIPALVDSGASLNILPFDIGNALNLNWNEQTYPLDLGGVLKGTQAFAVVLQTEVDGFPPVKLAYAWINKPSSEIKMILGQVNFFQEFDICFYGDQKAFEVRMHANF